jgi:triphosphoribosyl-dephospho-CoA synthetase
MTDIPWTISSMGQLSILLEASSPKPGKLDIDIFWQVHH